MSKKKHPIEFEAFVDSDDKESKTVVVYGDLLSVQEQLRFYTQRLTDDGYHKEAIKYSISEGEYGGSTFYGFAFFTRPKDYEATEAAQYEAHRELVVAELRPWLAKAVGEMVEEFILQVLDPKTLTIDLVAHQEDDSAIVEVCPDCEVFFDGICAECDLQDEACCDPDIAAADALDARLTSLEDQVADMAKNFTAVTAELIEALKALRA